MKRDPRFEVARTAAGWHARFIAANGRIVFSSEVYAKRAAAFRAIELIAGWPVRPYRDGFEVCVAVEVAPETGLLEVRLIDEREVTP